jgi:NAD-dependent SIR2 family protein deacetylase
MRSRYALAERLDAANPGYSERMRSHGAIEVAPDADAVLEDTGDFVMVDCDQCGGVLKPDIVYFGESVPRHVADRAFAMVDDAEAMLVAGSSLTVMSGLRFVRRAAKARKPVVIVNRGHTRADDLATLKIDHLCELILPSMSAIATLL